jgi:hypothetical protein
MDGERCWRSFRCSSSGRLLRLRRIGFWEVLVVGLRFLRCGVEGIYLVVCWAQHARCTVLESANVLL